MLSNYPIFSHVYLPFTLPSRPSASFNNYLSAVRVKTVRFIVHFEDRPLDLSRLSRGYLNRRLDPENPLTEWIRPVAGPDGGSPTGPTLAKQLPRLSLAPLE